MPRILAQPSDAFIGLDADFICSPLAVETDDDVAIAAAVGVGGTNAPADVATIQEALNRVPPDQGGPSPPLAGDGIAGKRPIEAISRFQKANVGFADGRVDPDKATIAALRTFSGGDGPDIPKIPSAPAAGAKKKSVLRAPKTPRAPDQADIGAMQIVSKLLKEAQRWISIADAVVGRAGDHLQDRANTLFKKEAARSFAACDKFFKLKGLPKSNALGALAFIRGIFLNMRACIEAQIRLDVDPASPLGFFQVDPTDNNAIPPPEALMFTSFGGFGKRGKNGKPPLEANGFRSDTIFVATKRIIADSLVLTD